jgi:hypothetical protein
MEPPPTTLRHHPNIMDFAGVALGGVTEYAPFACTCFGLAEPPRIHKPSAPSSLTEHALGTNTPEDIVGYITGETSLEHMERHKTVMLSYPIATSEKQRATFKFKHGQYCDHSTAFLTGCQFGASKSPSFVAEALFIDLTPGQVAAVVMQGVIKRGTWTSKEIRKKAVLGKVDKLPIEKFDELVALVAPDLSNLECVAVLRPEGAFPELLPIKIELKFLNIPFKWVSLTDLSYGSFALMLHRLERYSRCGHIPRSKRPPNVRYMHLADGTLLDTTHRARYIFTTSKDNQITATLRFGSKSIRYTENVEYEKIVIRGLTPRPKGDARIKVIIQRDTINFGGGQVVRIQDLGSNLDMRLSLREKPRDGIEEMGGDSVESPVQYAKPVYGIDGVIGELPE